MKQTVKAFLGLATWAFLTGCTQGNNTGGATMAGATLGGVAGAVLFHGSNQTAAIIGSTVVGGIVGNAVGKKMDQDERKTYYYYGAPYYGYPYPQYVPAPQNCHYVTHTVYDTVAHVARTVSGTICYYPELQQWRWI